MNTKQLQEIPLETPLQSIALSFSGGGYRAAAFALGTISYLGRVKYEGEITLLDNVSFISSASGGTITAMFYSLHRRAKPFKDIYEELLNLLKGDTLLRAALATLNDDTQWNDGDTKQRNLINAFAKTYDTLFFNGKTFGEYWHAANKNFEICFNTTEFTRGLYFRFQTDGDSNTYELIGNRFIHFDKNQLETVKQIKLADILAASSCFPSGFEPITFPEDFSHSSVSNANLRKAMLLERYDKTVSPLQEGESLNLMDGGIADNQGLQSAMLADERKRKAKRKPFDTFIISDVASYYMHAYKMPPEPKPQAWSDQTLDFYVKRTKKFVNLLSWLPVLSITLLVASVAVIFITKVPIVKLAATFLSALTLLITLILLYLDGIRKKLKLDKVFGKNFDPKATLRKYLPTIRSFSDEVLDNLLQFFRGTKISVLRRLIVTRATSVMTMVSDINLKHVRRLIYEEFYDKTIWADRRCPNFIYELSKENNAARNVRLLKADYLTEENKRVLHAPDNIVEAAEEARTVGTTLWHYPIPPDQLRAVTSCGQFSTCVNLLEYIFKIENNKKLILDPAERNRLAAIKSQLLDDWGQFKTNPYFLYQR